MRRIAVVLVLIFACCGFVSGKEGLASSRLVEAAHRSIGAGGGLIRMKDVEDV